MLIAMEGRYSYATSGVVPVVVVVRDGRCLNIEGDVLGKECPDGVWE